MDRSVSKEQVWQKWMDTTLFTTVSIVACHSGESAGVGPRGSMRGSSSSSSSMS